METEVDGRGAGTVTPCCVQFRVGKSPGQSEGYTQMPPSIASSAYHSTYTNTAVPVVGIGPSAVTSIVEVSGGTANSTEWR